MYIFKTKSIDINFLYLIAKWHIRYVQYYHTFAILVSFVWKSQKTLSTNELEYTYALIDEVNFMWYLYLAYK